MTFRSLSSQSICTFSVCARASARGPQPLSWNLARASHSATLHLSPVLDHQSILCISEFISSFIDTTCQLHYPFNLGFNNPRFFLGFFFFFPLYLIKSLYSCLICFSWEMRQKSVSFPILWRLLLLTLNRFFPNSPSFHICHIKWTSLLSPAARA